MLGAAAMSLSSFTVCMNALRLNRFPVHDAGRDRARRRKTKARAGTAGESAPAEAVKEDRMKKEMKIEGMMCQHCEASVKKALEALDGVTDANVSHEAGSAVVEMTKDVPDEEMKNAVEARDYAVKSITRLI